MMTQLEDMQAEVLEVNKANGWFDDSRTFGDDIALLHSEVSEMFEEYREHGLEDYTDDYIPMHRENPKPLGVGSEAADILIRLLDTCERQGINLGWEYARKITYNRTRGYKHGGKII